MSIRPDPIFSLNSLQGMKLQDNSEHSTRDMNSIDFFRTTYNVFVENQDDFKTFLNDVKKTRQTPELQNISEQHYIKNLYIYLKSHVGAIGKIISLESSFSVNDVKKAVDLLCKIYDSRDREEFNQKKLWYQGIKSDFTQDINEVINNAEFVSTFINSASFYNKDEIVRIKYNSSKFKNIKKLNLKNSNDKAVEKKNTKKVSELAEEKKIVETIVMEDSVDLEEDPLQPIQTCCHDNKIPTVVEIELDNAENELDILTNFENVEVRKEDNIVKLKDIMEYPIIEPRKTYVRSMIKILIFIFNLIVIIFFMGLIFFRL